MFGTVGPTELILIIIAIAILLIWGPTKIPGLARAIGEAIREFKRGVRGITEEVKVSENEVETYKKAKQTLDTGKILELAKKLGIPTEGKDINQIIEEIDKKLSELKK